MRIELPPEVRYERHERLVREYRELLIELATKGTKDRALRELAARHEITRERARQIMAEKWEVQW